ncbi:MAG TPA: AMIN domain-containing protein [Candidatus Sulfotelmatobacter sp.]|nr:AMIN domain-containing protein [Candidatus Sulfotelmatobacter sp.]
MEITSTRPIRPVITRIPEPPGLQIDLSNARISVPHKQIPVQNSLIDTIQLDQLPQNPPLVRILVSPRTPLSYTWDAAGNRLTIRFHMESEAASARAPSVPAIAPAPQPVAVPVSAAGNLTFADQSKSGSSFSAKFSTETLRLARGGEVHLCPGTTVSIVHQTSGPDLMLAMGVGALETHYTLDNSADTIVTPDFRILLRGPGEFHYAIRVDAQGNTCVRGLPGNTAPVVVYEALGNGQFEVVPTDKLVLHAGHLSTMDTAFHSGQASQVETIVPDDCGCPPPPPVLRAESPNLPVLAQNTLPPTVTTAQPRDESDLPHDTNTETLSNGPEVAAPPLPALNQRPARAGASLVFSSRDARPPKLIDLPLSERQLPILDDAVQAPVHGQATNRRKSVLRRLGGFFSRLFQ